MLATIHVPVISAGHHPEAMERIRHFVQSSLVDRDSKSASSALSVEAGMNKAMLAEDCAGYSGTPRTRFESFMSDISRNARLDPGPVRRFARALKPIHDAGSDKFLVVQLDRNSAARLVEGQNAQEFLRRHLPAGRVYTLFVGLKGGGVLYFIWIGTGAKVRIYHAGMFCT